MLNLDVPRATTQKGSQPVFAGFPKSPLLSEILKSPQGHRLETLRWVIHCFSTRMVELPNLLVATNA